MGFLLALPVAVGCVYNGQANLLMTGLLLLGLTAAAEDRWWRAAACLAAATLIKAFPLALAFVFTALFWRAFPLRFLAALLAGLAVPFVAQRPENALDQTDRWLGHLTESIELNSDRLHSLDKLLELAGAGVGPRVFLLFGAAAGVGVLAAAVQTKRRGASRREVLLVALAWFLTWVVLFSPSSETATYAILAPVVAWAVVDAFSRPGQWGRRVCILTSVCCLSPSLRCTVGR